jgi:hypothetical protein
MSENHTDRVYEADKYVCPKSGHLLNVGIDLGDQYLHDICPGCRFKRKRRKDGKPLKDEEQKGYMYRLDDIIVAGS